MTRAITSDVLAAISQDDVRPILLAEFETIGAPIRVCSLARDISWNGQNWLGNGWLQPIDQIEENTDQKATGVSIQILAGPDAVSLALESFKHSNRGTLWVGFLNGAGAVIADPIKVFSGRLDSPEIDDNGGDSTISLKYESDYVDADQPREFRYTAESQKAYFAEDKGFDYAPTVADWSGFWGRATRWRSLLKERKTKAKN